MTVCLSVVVAKFQMILLASLLSSEVQIVPNGHPTQGLESVATFILPSPESHTIRTVGPIRLEKQKTIVY